MTSPVQSHSAPVPPSSRIGAQSQDLVAQSEKIASIQLHRDGVLPSPADASEVKRLSSQLAFDLAWIEDEIVRLQQLRETVSTQLAINTSYVAPVRRLAPDILQEIFSFCAAQQRHEWNISWDERDEYEQKRGRWLHSDGHHRFSEIDEPQRPSGYNIGDKLGDPAYTRVCVAWRRASLDMPSLWNHILVDYPSMFTNMHLAAIHATSRFIVRSSQHPLYVRMAYGTNHYSGYDEEEPLARTQAFIRMYKTIHTMSSHRWTSLQLSGDTGLLRGLPDDTLEALETVDIYALTRSEDLELEEPNMDQPHAFLFNSPSVRHFTLDMCSLYSQHLEIPSSWQLSTLSLTVMNWAEVEDAVRQCARTVESLSVRALDMADVGDTTPINMPAIRHLCLDRFAFTILPIIISPNLHHLRIDSPFPGSIEDDLLRFVERSGGMQTSLCTLEIVQIVTEDALLQAIKACLRQLPAISTLRLARGQHRTAALTSFVDSDLLSILIVDDGSPPLVPGLKSLAVHVGHDERDHDDDEVKAKLKVAQALRVVLESRRTTRTLHDGQRVEALLTLETNLDGIEWPATDNNNV
ncbi:hypothetical protein BD626DRAFT_182099 [Schizophyllum amplum]|uniref:F-box domain-containing protein n=1 Tax=Schizophyllum amplum TaxID=97359 RepID=A0A550C1P6_9AGAR|nr:hypothetical protein BD626DRAFT_182099 [Auriculariopsis ampla]